MKLTRIIFGRSQNAGICLDIEVQRFFSFDDTDLIFDFQVLHAMQIPFIEKLMHLIEKWKNSMGGGGFGGAPNV